MNTLSGVATAGNTGSGRPAHRGDVALFSGPAWETWTPNDIETRGLGGAETAAVKLAESLSQLGYMVTFFGDCEEMAYRDVTFRRWETFEPREPRLATISVRIPWLFDRPLASFVRLFWAHDIHYDSALTPERARSMDAVVAPTEWHRRYLCRRYPFLEGKVHAIPNGLDASRFRDAGTQRDRRVLYTSAPQRGLDVLLRLWPTVRRLVPDAELVFCYPRAYDVMADRDRAMAEFYAEVERLADQPGVTRLGSLGQGELARLMTRSRVWAAPSWCTPCNAPFLETYCNSAVEAQAAGCCVVASAVGALTETVKVGRLVKAFPNGDRWRAEIIDGIVEALSNPTVQHHAECQGPPAVSELGWPGIAARFVRLLEGDAVASEGSRGARR
jgi:glycosyltransferase involved in cell wall biosynthesis